MRDYSLYVILKVVILKTYLGIFRYLEWKWWQKWCFSTLSKTMKLAIFKHLQNFITQRNLFHALIFGFFQNT